MKTNFTNEFSKEVFDMTYAFQDETIDDLHQRVAENLAQNEENKEWVEKFKDVLSEFKFIPGGRILANAGLDFRGTTYINCFVDGFVGEDKDSMDSIMDALKRQAMILKSEGGYGFCADVLRPRGGFVEGIGTGTPGSVRMLDMWDTQSAVITAGADKKLTNKKAKKKIRKGAQMVTMSVWHPDVPEFITAKQQKGRLTKFNMSVMITDDFMDAVKNHKEWNLEFPDFDTEEYHVRTDLSRNELLKRSGKTSMKDYYKELWDGNLKAWKSKGLPTKIYKTYKDANELWDLIMQSTYNRNEPGVLFIDRINHFNNLWYNEYINATNPCGEQALPVGGVCLLGSLNLTQFVKGKNWDYVKLGEAIPTAVRLMDNVNDITYVPLENQKENLQNKRRIGLGVMGYGSAMLMMNIPYGSKKALKLTDELMEFIANTAYQASAMIAKEKGAFPLFDANKHLQGKYIKNLSDGTKADIQKYGIRNSHLLSIQPTGNTAVFANNVSSGLEPVFMFEYKRAAIIPYPPEGLSMPKNINWEDKKFELQMYSLSPPESHYVEWKWIKEGDENLLTCNFEGDVYKFDQNRGLTKEAAVTDYGVLHLKEKNKWNPEADWATDTRSLTIDGHTDTMKVFAKWIDSSISKTINLPKDYKYEDFKDVYMNLYDSGTVKGGTTYREGTMTAVLYDAATAAPENGGRNGNRIIKTTAPKRPKHLDCDVYHITVKGKRWVVFVGMLKEDPYEVFALKSKHITLPEKIKNGVMTRVKSGTYNFKSDDGLILEDVTELFERDEEESLTRAISWGLRHGGSIEYAIDGLNKSEGTIISFNKAIARALKRYLPKVDVPDDTQCPVCTEHALVISEGCLKCTNCAWSKCD